MRKFSYKFNTCSINVNNLNYSKKSKNEHYSNTLQ